MRAVLLATGYIPSMDILLQHKPTPLLHVCDRPMIFHIIETLRHMNIDKFDIILYHMPTVMKERVGNGERWGVGITYHTARSIQNPLEILKPAAHIWEEEPILIGQGDTLPHFPPNSISKEPAIFYLPEGEWSEWAIITKKMLTSLPQGKSVEMLFKQEGKSYRHAVVEPFLSGKGFQELHDSNLNALKEEKPSLLFPSTATMIEPGIWMSRAVSLRPGVAITPPVFIGTDSHIHEGAAIGPNSVIERNCVIDKRSVVKDSVVCQQSYVGQDLTLNQAIVDRNLLINVALDTKIIIKDDFILDELTPLSIKWYIGFFIERIIACVLFLLNYPFYLILKLYYKIGTDQMLQLPASSHQTDWETFDWYYVAEYREGQRSIFLNYSKNIPNLLNIIRGYVHFVGSSPRTPKVTAQLPADWKKLYLKSKVGLVTLFDLENPQNPSKEDVYASEVFYAIHMGWGYDFKLMMRWIWKKINNFCIYMVRSIKKG